MISFLSIVALLVVIVLLYLQLPKFGKQPSGKRLELIKKSPNYLDGEFQNLSKTPALTEDVSYFDAMKQFLFSDKPRNKPTDSLPSVKIDLLHLNPAKDILVWFGHSSYFIQIDGKKILIDPVFSGAASPITATTRAFKGTDRYSAEDMPEIDYLFISHDHWDHLDYETVTKLKPKVKKVITGLGTGEHLEYWKFDPSIIVEKDWNEAIPLDSGFVAYSAPARHFSGRTFTRNKALWTSWVLQTPSMKIYIGGDSGYDTHFSEIGKKYGPIDIAILENGQYNKNWKYIHMMPGEIIKAANDLHAKSVFPVHSAKFALAMHPWDEPLKNAVEEFKNSTIKLITPIIGEEVRLKDSTQGFKEWWKGLN